VPPSVSQRARRGRTASGDRGGIYRTVSGKRLGIKRSRTEIETKLFCAVFSGLPKKVSGNVRFWAARGAETSRRNPNVYSVSAVFDARGSLENRAFRANMTHYRRKPETSFYLE
jgi:hypothetical protein